MAGNTVFQLKRSSVAGKKPTTSTLNTGELALNLTDRKLYSSDGTNIFETGANLTTLVVSTNTTVNNVIFGTGGIYANGSFGGSGATLFSNGSSVYWGTGAGTGTVTQVNSGNGLFGGPVTTVGTIYVLANTGIISNTSGVFVDPVYINTITTPPGSNTQIVFNDSGKSNALASFTFNKTTNTLFVSNTINTITVVANTINANGGVGTLGQVLTSNGTSSFWSSLNTSTPVRQQYTGDGSTTLFFVTGGYTPGTLSVYVNGVLSRNTTEVTATNGSSITFATPPNNGALIDVIGYVNNLPYSNFGPSILVSQQYTANGTANSFAITGGYIPGGVQVYLNGVKQIPFVDVDISSGANVNFYVTPSNTWAIDVFGFQSQIISASSVPDPLVANNLYIGGNVTVTKSSFTFGNSTVNTNINTSGITFGNSVANTSINSNGVNLSNTVLYIGNSSVNVVINSSSVYVNGGPLSGTNTNAQYVWSNAHTFNANVNINGNVTISTSAGISANGSYGTAGQALLSNGSTVYWGAAGVNTSAQYTWTNTQSFSANVVLNGNVVISNTIYANGSAGVAGQILVSNGAGVYWSNAATTIRQSFTGNGSATNFAITGGYTPLNLDVYVNGVKQESVVDVNLSSGANIVFTVAPPNGAYIDVVGLSPTTYTYANTSAQYSWTNTQTFSNLVMISTAGISANGSYGTNGQVLTSNGSSVYWSNSSVFVRQTFTGTGSATTFTVTGGYTPNNLDVYLNGVRQSNPTDVNTGSGSIIVFSTPPINGSTIDVVGVVPLNYTITNTSAQYTWTNTHSFTNAITANVINANNITSSNGLYSIGPFNGSYSDGIVTDYVTGNGRISVGPLDNLTFYTGGVAANQTMIINATGVFVNGTINSYSTTSSNGLYSIGPFNGSYSDGTVIDYVTGNGRISVGPGDGLSIYNAGVGANAMVTILANGNMGIACTSPTGLLDVSSRGITKGSMPAGSIIQVVNVPFTNVVSTTSATATNVPNFAVSITPSLVSSKILLIINCQIGMSTAGDAYCRVLRNGTLIDSSTSGSFGHTAGQYNLSTSDASICFLDSPATTSSVTYQVQFWTGAGTVYVNGRGYAGDQTTSSDITVMELAQ